MDGLDELSDVGEASDVPELELEVRVEGLLEAVLPRRGLPALGCLRPVQVEQRLVRAGDVLAALVGVEPLRGGSRPSHGVLERLHDERRRVVVGDVPADDFPCENVDHGRNVPEPVHVPEVGKVPGPDDICSQRTEDREDVRDERFRPSEVIRLREPDAAPDAGKKAEDVHHTGDGLPVHAQMHGDPTRAVGSMLFHDRDDLCPERPVGGRLLRLVVQGGAGDTELLRKGGLCRLRGAHTFTHRPDFFPRASFRVSAGR